MHRKGKRAAFNANLQVQDYMTQVSIEGNFYLLIGLISFIKLDLHLETLFLAQDSVLTLYLLWNRQRIFLRRIIDLARFVYTTAISIPVGSRQVQGQEVQSAK